MRRVFESRYLGQQVAIAESVLDEMLAAASAAGDRETGGILIGRYVGTDRGEVDHATAAPAGSRRGRTWFERGTAGLEALLQGHWNADVRRYYVGEWHFHPAFDGTPSNQDIVQMQEIATAERYRCRQPIMIIVAFDADHGWLVRVFLFPPDSGAVELLYMKEPAR